MNPQASHDHTGTRVIITLDAVKVFGGMGIFMATFEMLWFWSPLYQTGATVIPGSNGQVFANGWVSDPFPLHEGYMS